MAESIQTAEELHDADLHECEFGGYADELSTPCVHCGVPRIEALEEEHGIDDERYPTPWAYDQACKALWHHRERADINEKEVRRLQDVLRRLREEFPPASVGARSAGVHAELFDTAVLQSPRRTGLRTCRPTPRDHVHGVLE